jgi:hypothetical protein
MMYIKIQGTIVPVLPHASFFLPHYMLTRAEKVLSKLPAPPTKAQPAGLFKGMQRQMTETLVDNKLGILWKEATVV